MHSRVCEICRGKNIRVRFIWKRNRACCLRLHGRSSEPLDSASPEKEQEFSFLNVWPLPTATGTCGRTMGARRGAGGGPGFFFRGCLSWKLLYWTGLQGDWEVGEVWLFLRTETKR